MTSMKFHTLAWPNVAERMLESHGDVVSHFGLQVDYTRKRIPHGEWMDGICQSVFGEGGEVACFLEIDAVPTVKGMVEKAYNWVVENRGLLGIAQSANHLYAPHIYAAPAFYMIHRDAWEKVGASFSETAKTDVGQYVSMRAENIGVPVRALYPSHYLFLPDGERWNLGNYGRYGRGTFYRAGLFHLFQGRMNNSVNVFADICEKIVDNKFTTKGWHECERL